ncbi:MAG: ferritin-like domain-containing protein [Polyangiaceae bacterium]|nr:ferritin-like domain-containing protein [Polyangiaceae bacterium]
MTSDPTATAQATTATSPTATSEATEVATGPDPAATTTSATTTEGSAVRLRRPGWKSGANYCLGRSDANPSGKDCGTIPPFDALRTIPDQPNGMYGFELDPDATSAERKKIADACCFRVIRPRLGRPLRTGDSERTPIRAEIVRRPEWTEDTGRFLAAGAPSEERRAAARAWIDDALLEHASAAEFARLSLSLLALGAPPELVRQAHEAALDELRHATIAFSIASDLEGAPVGPGTLPVERSRVDTDFVSLVEACLLDGCIGEMLASLEAATAAEHCDVPTIREALTSIADDEAKHAGLAYAIVTWALEAAPLEARRTIAGMLQTVRAALVQELELTNAERPERPVSVATWGRLDPTDAARVHHACVKDVVLPLLSALAA